MKLPQASLDLQSALAEFDVWITPSLEEVSDTERFRQEMEKVVSVLDSMSEATGGFPDIEHCDPIRIANTFLSLIDGCEKEEALDTLLALASTLFLVTGRSDNNAKCQLPLFLRDHACWPTIPAIKKSKGKRRVVEKPIPRELSSKKYMKAVVSFSGFQQVQTKVLGEFIRFILSDDNCVAQLWSLGRSFVMLKELGKERSLLTPLIIFQVRGSVSASGGHVPEDLLRARLDEWGLNRTVDYNVNDIVVTNKNRRMGFMKKKERGYDFVLPFKTISWTHRIFIQCQFYAGDSGSVSHKNVDQTISSRAEVTQLFDNPLFVEYVDGAGYFSSLNGDLKSILSMDNTHSFFQVKSASIRLRRELQAIGFLTPLELEHALLRTDCDQQESKKLLLAEDYSVEEINRCIDYSIQRQFVHESDGKLIIAPERRELARRYLLLDITARNGGPPETSGEKLTGSLLVPGYGPFHGMKMDEVIEKAITVAPILRDDWSNPKVVAQDIRWLCDEGMAMSC